MVFCFWFAKLQKIGHNLAMNDKKTILLNVGFCFD